MDSGEKIEAIVILQTASTTFNRRGIITFERGYMFLTFLGKDEFNKHVCPIKPKKIERKRPHDSKGKFWVLEF